MTSAAIDALRRMASGAGEEFVYERGSGYIGNRRVKHAKLVLMELIHATAVRRIPTEGCDTEYYRIGPEGLAILKETPNAE